jgi:hypothetical protein
MGSIFNLGTDQVPYGGEDLGSQKIRAENFRIMIGAKF